MKTTPPIVASKVEKLLLSGWLPREIKSSVSVSGSFISQCRARLGIPKFTRGRPATIRAKPITSHAKINLDPQINEMLLAGTLPKQIRSKLGVCQWTVRRCAKKLGIFFGMGRPKGSRGSSPEIIAKASEARKLKSSGLTYRKIGELMGISFQRVQQYVRPENCVIGDQNYGMCPKCFRITKSLHNHHVSYETGETILICGSCHGNTYTMDKLKRKYGYPVK